jgi:hypothetical protein
MDTLGFYFSGYFFLGCGEYSKFKAKDTIGFASSTGRVNSLTM